jgi:hypothetical protein
MVSLREAISQWQNHMGCFDDSDYLLLANQSLSFQIGSPNKKARLTNSGLRSEYQNNSRNNYPSQASPRRERREYNIVWVYARGKF